MNASARTTTLALAAVAALTLTGCAGSEGETDNPAAPADPPTTQEQDDPEDQAEPQQQAQDVGGAAEASVEETTTVDYPSGLSVTLTKLEDISEEYNDYYADFGSELEGTDLAAVRVTWTFENTGDQPLAVDILPNSYSVTNCMEGEDRYPATGLYGESGLVWGPAAPTRLSPGSSFEYAETCMLTPGEPWAVELLPYGVEGEHQPFTFTDAHTLL